MKAFKLNNEYQVICTAENTRYGFRHLASLLKNGYEVSKSKACYYNRTWESFEYETVILQVIDKYFKGEEHKIFIDKVRGSNSNYGALLV